MAATREAFLELLDLYGESFSYQGTEAKVVLGRLVDLKYDIELRPGERDGLSARCLRSAWSPIPKMGEKLTSVSSSVDYRIAYVDDNHFSDTIMIVLAY